MKTLKYAGLGTALAFATSLGLAHADVQSSCESVVEAEYPAEMADAGKQACSCLADAISGDSALESEAVALAALPQSERDGAASAELGEILASCFGG
ncbi:MAG: hypothetical protein AAGC95_16820 [Pseudomonadota bacterium]